MERLMPALAPAELSQTLHETNVRLRFWLDSLTPGATPPNTMPAIPVVPLPDQPRAATPQQMAGLLSELMRAGQCLRALPKEGEGEGGGHDEKDAALGQELSQYRTSVERLRALLPSIHHTLLEERARLEQERARVRSAAEWASRSRQTL
jgi:hypothetical protein